MRGSNPRDALYTSKSRGAGTASPTRDVESQTCSVKGGAHRPLGGHRGAARRVPLRHGPAGVRRARQTPDRERRQEVPAWSNEDDFKKSLALGVALEIPEGGVPSERCQMSSERPNSKTRRPQCSTCRPRVAPRRRPDTAAESRYARRGARSEVHVALVSVCECLARRNQVLFCLGLLVCLLAENGFLLYTATCAPLRRP